MKKNIFILSNLKTFFVLFLLVFSCVQVSLAEGGSKTLGASCTVGLTKDDCENGLVCESETMRSGSSGKCVGLSSVNDKTLENVTVSSQKPVTSKAPAPADFSDIGKIIVNFNKNIVQNLIMLLSAVALVVFLWGLVQFIIDRNRGKDGEKLEKDKKAMGWGLIALFVLVSVWGIIRMAQWMLGVPTDNTINLPKVCVDGNCTIGSNIPSQEGAKAGGVFNDPVEKISNINQCPSGRVLSADGWNCLTPQEKALEDAKNLPPINPTTQNTSNFPELSIGDTDANSNGYVSIIQNIIKARNCTDALGREIAIDGIYAQKTFEAVKKFQTANFLKIDGIVGGTTWSAINTDRQGQGLRSCN